MFVRRRVVQVRGGLDLHGAVPRRTASDDGLPLPLGRARRRRPRSASRSPARRLARLVASSAGSTAVDRHRETAAAHKRPQSTAPPARSPFRAGRARRGCTAQQKSTPSSSFSAFHPPTMTQSRLCAAALLAASLAGARANAHAPTTAPTRAAAPAPTTPPPTPRPTVTDRRRSDAAEIPVRAAAFAAAGFAALGLIAAAVWHESRVERVGPSSPSLPRGLARKRCGTPRLGWHAWTPRLAQPRAPRGRLLPSRSRVRPTATLTVTTQVPPQGRQEDLRQPTPDAHQGPGFTVSKTSKTSSTPEHAARRGKLLPPPPPPRLRLD